MAIAIIATVLVVELVGAWVSGSLSLLADAGHMLSDLTGLIIALVATIVAARPATDRQTFGYQRAEVFGALINALILIAVAVSVLIEGVSRLVEPADAEVKSLPMLIVAVIGLVANLAALQVLRGGRDTSINMRGAYLEVLGDLLGSIAVIIAAVVIMATGFAQADAIASLAIAAMIVPRAWSLLRDVVARPQRVRAVRDGRAGDQRRTCSAPTASSPSTTSTSGQITSGEPVFSAHVVVEPDGVRRWSARGSCSTVSVRASTTTSTSSTRRSSWNPRSTPRTRSRTTADARCGPAVATARASGATGDQTVSFPRSRLKTSWSASFEAAARRSSSVMVPCSAFAFRLDWM